MVYQDFTPHPPSSKTPFRIPPLADRALAFVFDLVIFTPVFSFILANLFRKLELMYFVSPDSVEFMILCGVCFVFIALLTVLFQALFLVMMGATPGKYFFKIQVISLAEPGKRLRFSQALLRSFLWTVELCLLMLPFLEIFSDSLRRPLHDRAAGTMAVTLKEQGDRGPHMLETQFVRQILVASSLCLIAWSIFFVGNFYKLAIRGEFKKNDLESENYLCSEVSSSLKTGEDRMDKALAMYLADEISEDCLSAESDFVLWTPNEAEKSWAYLAKGILKKYDSEKFEAYLEKACEVAEDGEACEIAQFEADSSHPLPKKTQTASILRVTQDFEKGRYAEAEKEFVTLAQEEGFETFAQQGLVKALWAQNRIERAKGAYQNVVHQMGRLQGMELSAWICHEELDRTCTQEAVEACEDLKERSGKADIEESFVALALIREKECRQTSSVDYIQFRSLFEEKKDVLEYVKAIARDSRISNEERSRILQNLAFRKEPVRPVFLRRLAIQKWLDYAKSDSEFTKVSQFLKEKKTRDLSWIKIYEKSLRAFLKMHADKQIKEIVDLPSEDMIRTYQLQVEQVQAQYLARNYEKAWATLHSLQTSRSPASADGGLSLEFIRQDLEKKMKSRRSEK